MRVHFRETLNNRWLIFGLRLALGGIFIAASVGKIPHQAEFINTVTSYGILPDNLAQLYGSVLPWVELFIGCCLVLGIFLTFASALSILLVLSFIIASAYGLLHPIEDSCGCFGQLIPMSHSASVALDVIMLLMAVLLLRGNRAESLSVGALLSKLNPRWGRRGRFVFEKGIKFAAIAIVVLAIGIPLVGGAQNSIDSMLDDALEQGKPGFLFFYSEGCGDCDKEKPIINGLERDYEGRVVFIYISYKEELQAVEEFNVNKTPTMLLVVGKDSNGEFVFQRFDDFTSEEKLRDSLDQVLGSGAH